MDRSTPVQGGTAPAGGRFEVVEADRQLGPVPFPVTGLGPVIVPGVDPVITPVSFCERPGGVDAGPPGGFPVARNDYAPSTAGTTHDRYDRLVDDRP